MSPEHRAARVPPDAGRCAFWHRHVRAVLTGIIGAVVGIASPARAQLPPSTLAVRVGAHAQVWWQSHAAPAQWLGADPSLRDAMVWRRFAPGAEWATVALEGVGEASRLSLIVVRLEPAQVRAHLALPRPRGATWVIDSAPATALVAFNAGQFERDAPWGWVVSRGVVRWSPGRGPLSTALVWDSLGRWHWIAGRDVAMAARRHPPPFAAFQSYPTLLSADGTVPAILRRINPLVSVTHRDARLAIGEDRDGRLVIAMTRFAALGDALGRLPFGVTTPEMAAIMGALGCHTAVALDGGTSAQLQIRGADGRTERWPGLRAVPMGVVFEGVLPP